jgi:predicted enzyme related to lactoylglutathione lyase
MAISTTCTTIDCADPALVAQFWAHALGWHVAHVVPGGGARVDPPEGGAYLEFIVVPEPKTVKNRVHLGLTSDDLDADIERLCALGATVGWEEDFGPDATYRNVILRDPEGNEFCLGTPQ